MQLLWVFFQVIIKKLVWLQRKRIWYIASSKHFVSPPGTIKRFFGRKHWVPLEFGRHRRMGDAGSGRDGPPRWLCILTLLELWLVVCICILLDISFFSRISGDLSHFARHFAGNNLLWTALPILSTKGPRAFKDLLQLYRGCQPR